MKRRDRMPWVVLFLIAILSLDFVICVSDFSRTGDTTLTCFEGSDGL